MSEREYPKLGITVFRWKPRRLPSGHLSSWVSVGPMTSGGVVGVFVQIGTWTRGISKRQWWL